MGEHNQEGSSRDFALLQRKLLEVFKGPKAWFNNAIAKMRGLMGKWKNKR